MQKGGNAYLHFCHKHSIVIKAKVSSCANLAATTSKKQFNKEVKIIIFKCYHLLNFRGIKFFNWRPSRDRNSKISVISEKNNKVKFVE